MWATPVVHLEDPKLVILPPRSCLSYAATFQLHAKTLSNAVYRFEFETKFEPTPLLPCNHDHLAYG